jgi:hypothetical protein
VDEKIPVVKNGQTYFTFFDCEYGVTTLGLDHQSFSGFRRCVSIAGFFVYGIVG